MSRPRSLSFELWSVNRWLRYTGLRLFIEYDPDPNVPLRVGIGWYGLPGSEGWRRIEPVPDASDS